MNWFSSWDSVACPACPQLAYAFPPALLITITLSIWDSLSPSLSQIASYWTLWPRYSPRIRTHLQIDPCLSPCGLLRFWMEAGSPPRIYPSSSCFALLCKDWPETTASSDQQEAALTWQSNTSVNLFSILTWLALLLFRLNPYAAVRSMLRFSNIVRGWYGAIPLTLWTIHCWPAMKEVDLFLWSSFLWAYLHSKTKAKKISFYLEVTEQTNASQVTEPYWR